MKAKFKVDDRIDFHWGVAIFTAIITKVTKNCYYYTFLTNETFPSQIGLNTKIAKPVLDEYAILINIIDYNKFWTKFNEAQIL